MSTSPPSQSTAIQPGFTFPPPDSTGISGPGCMSISPSMSGIGADIGSAPTPPSAPQSSHPSLFYGFFVLSAIAMIALGIVYMAGALDMDEEIKFKLWSIMIVGGVCAVILAPLCVFCFFCVDLAHAAHLESADVSQIHWSENQRNRIAGCVKGFTSFCDRRSRKKNWKRRKRLAQKLVSRPGKIEPSMSSQELSDFHPVADPNAVVAPAMIPGMVGVAPVGMGVPGQVGAVGMGVPGQVGMPPVGMGVPRQVGVGVVPGMVVPGQSQVACVPGMMGVVPGQQAGMPGMGVQQVVPGGYEVKQPTAPNAYGSTAGGLQPPYGSDSATGFGTAGGFM